MSEAVIQIQNVGKKYIISHHQRNQNPTLKEALAGAACSLARHAGLAASPDGPNPHKEEFWALRDVSLQIAQGERIGIIGRNGAGKSTLLKILSRITEPTEGRIRIKGRVASLLEVGTGFHPELTGRENIFLNGAVLGMTMAEIRRKFDEIVDFAEVEKFLDTPVKRYSSGMYVRLAFAVAAHLEPEILIVDEVLAVGDAAFQRKCLGKMERAASEGRTVLFVSHNIPSILSLTNTCLYLEHGRLAELGETQGVVKKYLQQWDALTARKGKIDISTAPRDPDYTIRNAEYEWIELLNARGEQSGTFFEGEPVTINLGFSLGKPVNEFQLGCTIKTGQGEIVLFTAVSPESTGTLKQGTYRSRLAIDPNYLSVGDYIVTLRLLSEGKCLDHIREAAAVSIQPALSTPDSTNKSQKWIKGYMHFNYQWDSIESA